ncbi:SixA phosphatase family protein [Acidithrix ferrooxidans]|uniref:Histidine phosphatase superfamily (Branch 1) n=1 Tax=Acidithrix ferrooxidans TaxID=1280514 RepID=A0A0D8HJ40_9ACTN|nr:phosphoglycerate mutase family protein [Acidithrix ferrooxidans]KJF17111.1 histidine phosphatase superfamily (branch 1) [Acidithrix ferrooxidans]
MTASNLYLIRHAKAGERLHDSKDDQDRSLSAKGKLQAEMIAQHLGNRPINFLWASPYARAIETLTPLSTVSQKKIMIDRRIGEDASIKELDTFIEEVIHLEGEHAICSHGNIIPLILRLLERYSPDSIRCAKGSIYRVDLSKLEVEYLEFKVV